MFTKERTTQGHSEYKYGLAKEEKIAKYKGGKYIKEDMCKWQFITSHENPTNTRMEISLEEVTEY